MLLSIIIVSYNTKGLTLETIASVVNTTKESKLLKNNLEIIVVDNNSHDETVVELKKLIKQIDIPILIIENKRNVGFGSANNQGIEKATGEYFLFLNSDTIVKDNALENMVKRFLDQQNKIDESIDSLGILTPVLLNLDLTYQAQGGSFPTLISLFFHMSMMDDLPLVGKFFPSTQHSGKTSRLNLEKLEHSNKLIPVDWVGGTAMMIAKKVLDNIGPFDQNIFMYGEDTEICMRARDHHYKVALDPTAKIIHLQNKSSSSQNAIMGEFKGYLYIFSKHQTTFQTEIAKILLQIGALIRIFVFSFIAPNIDKTKIYKKVLADIS